MPTPLQLNGKAIRDSLIADMATPWEVTRVHSGQPPIAPPAGEFATVYESEPSVLGRTPTIIRIRHNIELFGRWPWPDDGSQIEDAKETRVNQALDVILAAPGYSIAYAVHFVTHTYDEDVVNNRRQYTVRVQLAFDVAYRDDRN